MLVRLLRGTGLRISEVVGDRNKGISGIKVRDFFRQGSDYLLRARRFKREQGHSAPGGLRRTFPGTGPSLDDYIRLTGLGPEARPSTWTGAPRQSSKARHSK